MPRAKPLRVLLDGLQRAEFPRVVLAAAMAIDRDAFRPGNFREVEARPRRDLTEAEFHALATSFSLVHLLGVLEQLARTPAYLREYRRTPALAAAGGTRASDLVYHLEGFLVRVGTFRDRTLHLSAAVCHTGLDGRSVNQGTVTSNRIVQSTGVATKLKALERLCSPYLRSRNLVVHEHGLLEEDIRSVEGLLLASRLLPVPRRFAAAAAYRRQVQELAINKGIEVERFVKNALEFSSDLFGLLREKYELKQRQLANA
jgi:hypothetical protein